MRMPKILPWLARRATVSDSRAAVLWDEACRQAAAVTGERDTSCYWGAAQQNLLYLLEKERWRSNPPLVWPWLLLHDGLECWSRLAKRWLAPVSSAVSAWPASAGHDRVKRAQHPSEVQPHRGVTHISRALENHPTL